MLHPESALPTSLLRERMGRVEDSTRFVLDLRDAVETDWNENSKDSLMARINHSQEQNGERFPAEIIAQAVIDEAQHVENVGRASIECGVGNGALALDFASGMRFLMEPLIEPTDEIKERLRSQDPLGLGVIQGGSDQVLLRGEIPDGQIEPYQSRSAFRVGVLTGFGLHIRAISTVEALLSDGNTLP